MIMIRPRRSVLFMPASNARALEKARDLACDAVILDLEDAVAAEAKILARTQAVAAVKSFGPREVIIRINSQDSPWGKDDLAAAVAAAPDAILVPKVSTPNDFAEVRRAVPASIPLWANIETPLGILNAPAIAAAGAACLVLGANDLAKQLHATALPDRRNLWTAMGLVVLAARAHGASVLDGTYNVIGDDAGLTAACEQGKTFGFDGKALVHPGQIEICNRIFSPSESEIAEAERLLAAFPSGAGVLNFEGRMVEQLHADNAARLVALAGAIATRRI
jgi:citrate lyase beta subunit